MNKWIKAHFSLSEETKVEIKNGLWDILEVLFLPLFCLGLGIVYLLLAMWIKLLQLLLPLFFVLVIIIQICNYWKNIKEWFNDTIVDNIRKGLNVLMHPKECIFKPLYNLFKC